jgi:hypothetical protein
MTLSKPEEFLYPPRSSFAESGWLQEAMYRVPLQVFHIAPLLAIKIAISVNLELC